MVNIFQKANAKAVPIPAYLASKGILPVVQNGGEYCYFSPFREERTPSFFVNISANVYHDFAEPEKGTDNIKLVMKLDGCDYLQAIRILSEIDENQHIEFRQDLPASPQYQSFVKKIIGLKHPALINYITKTRHIPLKIASQYLNEIHYSTSKGDFFSLGFKNISGGYELRNQSFKGCIGKKDISICGNRSGIVAYVFEGFIDFLSLLASGRAVSDQACFFVLNSISLINQLPDLERFDLISVILDNDEAGQKATMTLTNKYVNAWNYSKMVFPGSKDFNDYLISKNGNKTAAH